MRHMDTKKIYLTKEGLGELKSEYEELTKVKRPDVLERVSQARSMGDLSENAEYVAAREELSFIDGRVDELEELIKQAVPIQESHAKGNHVVKLGSTVTVHIKGKKEVFTVVGEWEADPEEKRFPTNHLSGKLFLAKKLAKR